MTSATSAGVSSLADTLDEQLAAADAALAELYPGDRGVRQPIHTVYIPADRFTATTVPDWGREALEILAANGGSPEQFADATGMRLELASAVYPLVQRKLGSEPIEDLRIDFEDGFGNRPDAEEDAAAVAAAQALAQSVGDGNAAPFHGIRFKSFEAPTRRRGLRTLDLFLGELVRAGGLTDGFLLTLPKVTSVDQVQAMVTACAWLEDAHTLPAGRLGFEIQVETPQSILGSDGSALVARMIHASGGRCTGLHYGTYDYSASTGVSAEYQSMEHAVADYAKAVMQVAAAGTGVFVSDGSTNILPVGDDAAVRRGWSLHARLVRRSLERGYYQGWDLHPAQLPTRYAATYAFYREGLPEAVTRLRAYLGQQDSQFLDEPATAVALAGFVLRGLDCGAVDADELTTGIGADLPRLAQLARRRTD
ncbi:MAG TPA: aldolase [Nocardioidaceae bacterium]|nr:aldolase [Nocardioidaceae bacterium]